MVETKYPHRLVFVAGLPKSGSTWLENLVGEIPGYRKLAAYDPKNLLNSHVLDPMLIERAPFKGNFFIKTHVEARSDGINALLKYKVPTVIIVRDLRDQCVSRFYHVLNQPSHRHYSLYKNSDRTEAFAHCVNISLNEYADWVRNWLHVAQNENDLFLLVRYEDMHSDIKKQFCRVLRHFDICCGDNVIDGIIKEVSVRAKEGATLRKRLNTGNNTLRSGRVGDWKTHFSASDVKAFKAKANDVLVSLGYEQDNSW